MKTILAAAILIATALLGDAAAKAADTYDLGGSAKGTPSVVWYKPGGQNAVAVFVRGTDGHMYAQVGDGKGAGWTGWAPIGDLVLKSDPACVATTPNLIDCVAMGPGNAIYRIRHDAKKFTWSAWQNLGGAAAGAPGIARTVNEDGDLALNVFVAGPGKLLFINTLVDGDWSDWQSLGVTVGGTVACTDLLTEGAHCYDTSAGSAVQYSDLTRTTGDDILIADLGGAITGKAAPVSFGDDDDALLLFVNGPGHRLWVKSWDGTFGDWQQLPIAIGAGAPGCAIRKSGGAVWCATVSAGGSVEAYRILADEL